MLRGLFLALFIPRMLFAIFSGNVAESAILEEGFFIPDTFFLNFRPGFDFQISEELFRFCPAPRQNGFHGLKLKGSTPVFTVALNFKEFLDIYGVYGFKDATLYFSKGENRYSLKLQEKPLYAGGAKAVVFEIKNLSLGGDFKYFYFEANSDAPVRNEQVVLSEKCHVKYKGWQISIGLAYRISLFSPYVGFSVDRWSLHCDLPGLYTKPEVSAHEKERFNPYFGVAVIDRVFFLNFEGRLISEKAAIFSAGARF